MSPYDCLTVHVFARFVESSTERRSLEDHARCLLDLVENARGYYADKLVSEDFQWVFCVGPEETGCKITTAWKTTHRQRRRLMEGDRRAINRAGGRGKPDKKLVTACSYALKNLQTTPTS